MRIIILINDYYTMINSKNEQHLLKQFEIYLRNSHYSDNTTYNYVLDIRNFLKECGTEILKDRKEPDIEEIMKRAEEFMPLNFGTETPLTIGRAIIFKEQGAKAVINVAPFTCMPGNITQAVFQGLGEKIGIPVINMFYDGKKGENKNLERLLPFLWS